MPSRRLDRELALQALYSAEIGHRDTGEVLDVDDTEGAGVETVALVSEIVA